MAKVDAYLELSNMRYAELEEQEKKKVADLEKAMEELKARCSTLGIEKVWVEIELNQLQDNTLLMLGEGFNQVVGQAHVLYKGAPPESAFDINKDVFEARLVFFHELVALRNPTLRTTVEDKDN